MKLTKEDRLKIENEVAKSELKTSGEIIPIILKASDDYRIANYRGAIILGILSSILICFLYEAEHVFTLTIIPLIGLLSGFSMAEIPIVKRLLLSKHEMNSSVHDKAILLFHANSVSATKDRTGILIYLSIFERRVEILADSGINSKVGNQFWDNVVEDLVASIKRDSFADGLSDAVKKCGGLLSDHFPSKKDDINELSNRLITDL